jgi:hypothetical protein
MTPLDDVQAMATAYAADVRLLLGFPAGPERKAVEIGPTRAAPPDLPTRADALIATSSRLGRALAPHLDAEDRTRREAAELKLLAQASVKIEVARRLIVEADGNAGVGALAKASPLPAPSPTDPAVEAALGALETPLSLGLDPLLPATKGRRIGAAGPATRRRSAGQRKRSTPSPAGSTPRPPRSNGCWAGLRWRRSCRSSPDRMARP